ncbi:hypothetical protein KOR42_02870 [Thalassoglobus neptunius]|uniref:Uncharacterized protein n=1 Tax=Thalassoglobus neptunius TaxID=1938619 RepID=A0A5C5X3P2_9PLAN|nr:hypothetical protein [Thalassoglobus neptunius]TWT56931.1 hypothetical protein KOR42_02870 [Thalassoglobus neptunius]
MGQWNGQLRETGKLRWAGGGWKWLRWGISSGGSSFQEATSVEVISDSHQCD